MADLPFKQSMANSVARRDQMLEILRVSATLINLAEAGNWQRLSETYQTRQQLLEAFFDVTPTAREADWIRDSIEQVLACDEKIREKAEASKFELAKELDKGEKGRQVIAAYKENSR